MERLFGRIADVFEITGRGCYVAVNDDDIAPGVELHVGDQIMVVRDGCKPLRTTVEGVELGSRSSRPQRGFVAVRIGPEINKSDVWPGSCLVKESENAQQSERTRLRAILEALQASAAAKATPGPSAARSHDFLYDDDGLPG